MKILTEQVSPIELQKGDRVEAYGALLEVMLIVESDCDVPGGVRVAACVSGLSGTPQILFRVDGWKRPRRCRNGAQPGPQGCTGTFKAMPMTE